MWHRRLRGALLFFLLELLKSPIGMTPYLVRSRLRKRLGLVTGASRDQREDEQPHYYNDYLTLLHAAPSMIHPPPIPSGDVHLLFKCAMQIEDRLHDASVYGLATPSLIVDMV